ncbi:hepatitis A virus cellular receptor 1-like isoform X5 [Labeo rohita]|uniref:hepatitis A virus cellular receptor 1-like isoform X4 n=1 Tax=Labeo rohita TaxID=84645 RepID=UPI0021E27E9D|nr:hepatitis A virus cellular receptor 1-like isoform X4 [Labeo rohita]XP_050980075.1 hepatitis A virus cellular receptor 1-like isoform X5 [Labeo rohita]
MRLLLVSHLLVLLSVVSISKVRAQTTSATTTTVSTAESTTLPATSTTPVETTTTTPEPTTTTESTTLPATSTTPETTTTTPEPTTTTTGITTAPGPTTLSETTMSASTVSTTIATKSPWTAPAIFYPFGAAAGDTEILEFGGDTSQGLPSPLHLHTLIALTAAYMLIITDCLHSTNLYQKLILLTNFPHMEMKITLLRSGLNLMTLV